MTDDLIKRLRSQKAVDGRPHEIEQLTDEAAALIEQQATRIAALEAKCALFAASLAQSEMEVEERDMRIAALATVAPAVDAQPAPAQTALTDDAREKMISDLESEKTYLGSSRDSCSQHDKPRWDRLQTVIDHLSGGA